MIKLDLCYERCCSRLPVEKDSMSPIVSCLQPQLRVRIVAAAPNIAYLNAAKLALTRVQGDGGG